VVKRVRFRVFVYPLYSLVFALYSRYIDNQSYAFHTVIYRVISLFSDELLKTLSLSHNL
jgi:hypothetical protein